MLIQISEAFEMSSGLQGVLGGIAYLSLGFGSPFAGYLLRNYNHKIVLGYAIGVNNLLTLIWSLTPVGFWYSSTLFILIRFLMGLMQCIVCVFLPLWTNEFAPPSERTKWMGGLQVRYSLSLSVSPTFLSKLSNRQVFPLVSWGDMSLQRL
jgi:MFS family permease